MKMTNETIKTLTKATVWAVMVFLVVVTASALLPVSLQTLMTGFCLYYSVIILNLLLDRSQRW